MTALPTYVLITPARNEAQFIEPTIKSVLAQTVYPLKWIIVSDGSTDGTDDIVRRYASQHDWIELLRMPDREARDFAGKVHAIQAGQAKVADLPYQVIACLDADIRFDSGYFAYLLGKLNSDPKLGLVGTPYMETSGEVYDYRLVSPDHVSGACQVFRRECYEAIGGYVPIKGGAIDSVASISARMKGWKTHTFTDMVSSNHRAMGTAERSPIQARFHLGVRDYAIGNHPVWQFFRCINQARHKPYLLRGTALAAGYLWALVRRVERPVPREMMKFYRREQMRRLKFFFSHTAW
ncbi:MAG: glycosyltransferase family A protein [Terracidiphilus sp.]|nr:glycosyltransferase family A protein [Terracidiphilus sp.]MDR3775552.1 glycosyltransferase family A protein [Terracidiphilus sp.]